jgi:site-specific recombinase XerD
LRVVQGKGGKDRVVCVSNDRLQALIAYLEKRGHCRARKVLFPERGRFAGRPISVRGIQKRMEYYAQKTGSEFSCHQLRHTMATQLLNADADLVSIQDLMGHRRIKTTWRYASVSNVKVQRDYEKAMAEVLRKSVYPRRSRW